MWNGGRLQRRTIFGTVLTKCSAYEKSKKSEEHHWGNILYCSVESFVLSCSFEVHRKWTTQSLSMQFGSRETEWACPCWMRHMPILGTIFNLKRHVKHSKLVEQAHLFKKNKIKPQEIRYTGLNCSGWTWSERIFVTKTIYQPSQYQDAPGSPIPLRSPKCQCESNDCGNTRRTVPIGYKRQNERTKSSR